VVELRYHHFSIAMNEKRRLCMWAASNADYTEGMRDERPRDAFGGEDWREDPRLPSELQILNEEFYGPATNVDRGHVVRRDDNCWGETRLEREYANADSYHWTNCTPQHEAFNQERPKGAQYKDIQGLWGGLESHLVRQLKAVGNRASQFAGPVLDNGNDPHRDFGSGDIQYPTRFWKIIAVVGVENQHPRLYVYGFLLDQSDVIGKFKLEERIELGKFAAQARPLTEIEALTGLTFAKIFHDHDEIAGHGAIPLDGSESLRPVLPAEGVASGVVASAKASAVDAKVKA
jgi:endonuclease G, mitochondrial